MYKFAIFTFLLGVLWVSCKPTRDDDIQLPNAPDAPQFSVEMLGNDSNRMVIKDLSMGNFQRLWDLPGGTPKTSSKAIDTVFYNKTGVFKVTLFVSKSDGSGTASASKTATILKDAALTCNPKLALLTGDCEPMGKCWTLSRAAGAVKVGPTYDDYSWFTSLVNGLQDSQYDDGFCFTFPNLVFQNRNNGASVDPWDGYQAKAHEPGVSDFTFLPNTGTNNRDQIILADDQFMGVWDCDNVLDIVKLTANELIVRGKQREKNGTPKPEGWFELVFIPQ
jgi:hypothetical protein